MSLAKGPGAEQCTPRLGCYVSGNMAVLIRNNTMLGILYYQNGGYEGTRTLLSVFLEVFDHVVSSQLSMLINIEELTHRTRTLRNRFNVTSTKTLLHSVLVRFLAVPVRTKT